MIDKYVDKIDTITTNKNVSKKLSKESIIGSLLNGV